MEDTVVPVFNRVVVVVAAAVILAGAVVTLLVAAGVCTPDILPHAWFESQLQRVAEATGASVAGIIAVSVIVALVMLTILFFELVPLRKPVSLLISSSEDGVTTIDADSLCVLAEKTVITIHSVHEVDCHLRESMAGLLFFCRVSVTLGTNILEVDPEMRSKIKEAVEELTGLTVAQVNIKLKYKPVDARRLAVR